MRELKASTKAGDNIISRAKYFDGYTLDDVYTSYSQAKYNAYIWCREQFEQTDESTAFSICSHNIFGFTCSWLGKQDGENILRYETKDNSYLVWLDR